MRPQKNRNVLFSTYLVNIFTSGAGVETGTLKIVLNNFYVNHI